MISVALFLEPFISIKNFFAKTFYLCVSQIHLFFIDWLIFAFLALKGRDFLYLQLFFFGLNLLIGGICHLINLFSQTLLLRCVSQQHLTPLPGDFPSLPQRPCGTDHPSLTVRIWHKQSRDHHFSPTRPQLYRILDF